VRILFTILITLGIWGGLRFFPIPDPPTPPPEPPPFVQAGVEEKKEVRMEFVRIPPGEFMMGSPENEPGRYSDEKQHKVVLTQGFYMQTTEVTQEQWKSVMGSNPSDFKDCDQCPVENVSWNDAQEFIRKLNQKEGKEVYRLPTEAEWEYAARAGSRTAFANGDITELECKSDPNLEKMGWYCGNSENKPHAVGQKSPNAWGLYDMHGNVWEWCQDWYGDYPDGTVSDPVGPPTGSNRVGRGGSWDNDAQVCRSADRGRSDPGNRSRNLGFRLLRSVP
jgi:formylglycine-generating enzyme required for sulfatase activity